MKGRRTCLKALIRKMDGGFFDFKPKGKFFLLLMELVLAILSQEDLFLGERRKALA
jgi:hypothetical protein